MSVDKQLENAILKKIFSDARSVCIDDVIAVGGYLNSDILSFAYDRGVFPWPHEGYPMLWFSPEKRGVIDFEDLHLSRSFKKWMKKNSDLYEVRMNTQFSEVVRQCKKQARKGQKGTWINSEIEKAYLDLFKLDRAFSLEIYRQGELMGGIYGVKSAKYYSCESMFHKEDNTPKLELYEHIKRLQIENVAWIDIQMVTSVCESFGGKYLSKKEFLERLRS